MQRKAGDILEYNPVMDLVNNDLKLNINNHLFSFLFFIVPMFFNQYRKFY